MDGTAQIGSSGKSQVETELDRMKNTIEEQQTLISELDSRLMPVSREQTPDPPQSGQAAVTVDGLVPVADSIRSLRFSAERNNKRILDMMNALEV